MRGLFYAKISGIQTGFAAAPSVLAFYHQAVRMTVFRSVIFMAPAAAAIQCPVQTHAA
ncbi:hypothetical protein ACPR111641_00910 [Acinetobacter pragensis]